MSEIRIMRASVQVLITSDQISEARVSQVMVEALAMPDFREARTTRLGVQILRPTEGQGVRITKLAVTALLATESDVRVSRVAVQVLKG